MIASAAYLQNTSHTAPSVLERLVALLFAVLLALFACAFCWGGVRAIATQRQEMTWREIYGFTIGPIGLVGRGRQGVEIYRGADAVRSGVGFIASGVIFGVWAATVLCCGVIGRQTSGKPGMIGQLATALSLLCLLLLSVCFFPPWQLWAIWFWAELLVWAAFIVASARIPRVRDYGPWLGIGTVATAMVLGMLAVPGAFVGLALALFAFMIGFAHVLYLSPRLNSWMDEWSSRQET